MRTEDVSVTTMNNLEITSNLNELIEHPLCNEVSIYKGTLDPVKYVVNVWGSFDKPGGLLICKGDTLAEALWNAVEEFKSLSVKDEE